MTGERREGCPEWCVADHDEEDEGERVRHRSVVTEVSVIERNVASAGDTTVLVIEMYRFDGESTTWVYVGDGFDQYLEVSLESIARLLVELARL